MYNTENEQVLENLLEHRAGCDDGKKIGLVIQGGGIRGAFPAGVAAYMIELGLNESFDIIYTASSACNTGLWFLDGRHNVGLSCYWEEMAGFKFLKPWRLKNIMDLNILERINTGRNLDVNKIKRSKTLLKFFVTNYETGAVEYFTNHNGDDLNKVAMASSAYPGLCQPVEINGARYIDGNIATILPIEKAIEDRCTDILVITTVPRSYVAKAASKFFRVLGSCFVRNSSLELKRVQSRRTAMYNDSLDLAFGRTLPGSDVRIYTIYPDYKIKNLENNAKVIKKYAEHGVEKARQILESTLVLE